MNKFKESLKVNHREEDTLKLETEKEKMEYEEYLREKYAKEIHKEKWDNARKRMEGEER